MTRNPWNRQREEEEGATQARHGGEATPLLSAPLFPQGFPRRRLRVSECPRGSWCVCDCGTRVVCTCDCAGARLCV